MADTELDVIFVVIKHYDVHLMVSYDVHIDTATLSSSLLISFTVLLDERFLPHYTALS